MSKGKPKSSIRDMAISGLFAALVAVLAQISIPLPFSPVPITGQVFGVLLAGSILGSSLGALSLMVYVLLGAIGLPVFAGAHGGLGVLAGPSGGYIWGFIAGAYVLGKIVESGGAKCSYERIALGMFSCLGIVYFLGTVQLALVLRVGIGRAVALGVVPFIALDIAKALLAAALSLAVRRALALANLLPGVART